LRRKERCVAVYGRAAIFVEKDSERREAGGRNRRATDKVRAGKQFEGGETDRPDDSAESAGESG
jgi:hypothetical protein